MALTPAEKQRRHRAHRSGDHSLCDPARRCEALAAVERGEALAPARGARAQQLWDELAPRVRDSLDRVLLEEICASLDRLDRLRDSTSAADGVEARHQFTALRSAIADFRRSVRAPALTAPPEPPAGTDDSGPGAGPRNDFSTRLAARRAKTLTDHHDPDTQGVS